MDSIQGLSRWSQWYEQTKGKSLLQGRILVIPNLSGVAVLIRELVSC